MNVKDLLLKPIEPRREIVELPEFGDGVTVTVQGMTARAKNRFDMQFIRDGKPDTKKLRQMREMLVAACVVDESGNPVFSDDDVLRLGDQQASIIDRIFDACQRVNGGGVSDAEKNSD